MKPELCMSRRGLALAAVCLAASGCIVIDKEDRRPGGLVWMENQSVSWMPADLMHGGRAGMKSWAFVRVVAPPGATGCRVESGFFDGRNPYPKAKVGADGAAMLTVRNEQPQSVFVCVMPGGAEVRREAPSTKVTYMSRVSSTKETERSYWVVPPLVHVDQKNPDADKHWAAIGEEICAPASLGRYGAVCKPGMLDRMKAIDLGAPAG